MTLRRLGPVLGEVVGEGARVRQRAIAVAAPAGEDPGAVQSLPVEVHQLVQAGPREPVVAVPALLQELRYLRVARHQVVGGVHLGPGAEHPFEVPAAMDHVADEGLAAHCVERRIADRIRCNLDSALLNPAAQLGHALRGAACERGQLLVGGVEVPLVVGVPIHDVEDFVEDLRVAILVPAPGMRPGVVAMRVGQQEDLPGAIGRSRCAVPCALHRGRHGILHSALCVSNASST